MLEKLIFLVLARVRKLEANYFKRRMNLGGGIRFRHPLMVNFPEHIYIEDNVSINRNCTFLSP
jgi:hypothetical protein